MEALSINPDLENTTFTLPALEDYVPENVTYSPGDLYVYISDENPDLSLQVTLQGANGASDGEHLPPPLNLQKVSLYMPIHQLNLSLTHLNFIA